MRRFLCQGCLALLAVRRGHVCRVPYPAAKGDAGIARIGVVNLRCLRRLWLRSWRG